MNDAVRCPLSKFAPNESRGQMGRQKQADMSDRGQTRDYENKKFSKRSLRSVVVGIKRCWWQLGLGRTKVLHFDCDHAN